MPGFVIHMIQFIEINESAALDPRSEYFQYVHCGGIKVGHPCLGSTAHAAGWCTWALQGFWNLPVTFKSFLKVNLFVAPVSPSLSVGRC